MARIHVIRAIRSSLAAIGVFTACGVPVRSDRLQPVFAEPQTRSSRDVLSEGEFGSMLGRTTYEVVERLRPQFLFGIRNNPREPAGGVLQVYLNGIYQGGVSVLHTIPASVVAEVRFLSASVVSDWYGPYRPRGAAIAVRTRR